MDKVIKGLIRLQEARKLEESMGQDGKVELLVEPTNLADGKTKHISFTVSAVCE
jgi:hypothetical protein